MIDFVRNDWFTLLGFAVGAIGFVLSIVFYLRSREPIVPVFYRRSSVVIDKSARIRGLEVSLAGRVVEGHVAFTSVALWNRGPGVMEPTNVAAADPLRIEVVEGIEILDAWLISLPNPATQITISRESTRTVAIAFEYLGQADGCVVGLLRTSAIDSKTTAQHELATKLNDEVLLRGSIKGTRLRDYRKDREKVHRTFLDSIFDPITPKRRWLQPLFIPVAIGLIFLLLPVVVPLNVIDGLRGIMNSGTDATFTR